MPGDPSIRRAGGDRAAVRLSDDDVIAAMREIPGYLDISPGDFRLVFEVAHAHALRRILDSLRASDIMSTPARCFDLDTDLLQAATLLAERGFSGAPVTDSSGRVVGVISQKDLLVFMGIGPQASLMQIIAGCLCHEGSLTTALGDRAVGDIMSTPAVTAGPEATASTISVLLIEHGINRLPIVDAEMRPIGVVTRTDLVHSLGRLGQEATL